MKTIIRKAAVTCGVAFTSAAVALSGATSAWAADQALIIGGIGAGTMSDLMMAPLLGGRFKDDVRTNVVWPAEAGPMTGRNDLTLGASIDVGITNLTAAINTALGKLSRDADGNVLNGEKVTVVGLSAGSLVVDEVLRNMVASGDLIDPDEIQFVAVEDSSRQKLIKDSTYNRRFDYTYHTPPVTPYNIVVVTGEYDGLADMPDRWWNFLAVANAMAGAIVVHVPVMYSDLSKVPAKNITVETNASGGTTTHYLVPTTTLPLVQLNPRLKPREAELKAKIDSAYSRNDLVPVTAAKTVAAPPVDTATTDATTLGETTREDNAEAKAARTEAKAARTEARAQAKADRVAQREARKAARAQAAAGHSGSSSSSDDSGSSE